MTTRKKNKNQQKEGSGFIKKVSSLFNLDTVIFFLFLILLNLICYFLGVTYFQDVFFVDGGYLVLYR